MEITINLELGSKYEIAYADGRVRTFIVEGGPVPLVYFDDEKKGYSDLSLALVNFKSIVKIS